MRFYHVVPLYLLQTGMQLYYLLLLLFGNIFALPTIGYDPDEAVKTAFELSLYDLQDDFDNKAKATREAYVEINFEKKEHFERNFGASFKEIKKYLSNFSDIPEDIYYKWSILNRPGDYALPEKAWNKFVNFSNSIEKLKESANVSCNNVCIASKQEISNELEKSRNLTILETKWSAWQNVLAQKENEYSSVFQLVNNASEMNEQLNVNTYWEMLSDYDDGFIISEGLWNEVKPLYDKLRSFVKKRLYTYYNYTEEENFNETDTFPVYLSGTLLGDDWSNIADIVLPRPYLLYDAKTFLHTKSAKQIFQHAETVVTNLGFPKLSRKFWSTSSFNHTTCTNLLITFCEENHSEVLTCNSTSWKQYLEAHEIMIKSSLRDMEYDVCPLKELRGSSFDEAVVGLGAFLAINAMDKVGVVPECDIVQDGEVDIYQRKETLLLLTALRILPKLAFYFTADKWRLTELELMTYENLGESWENTREEIQGVRGVRTQEYDFLNDEYITSNKPYLSKFIGIFLQFQIIDYFKSYSEDETLYEIITADTTLYNIIKERLNSPWQELMSNNFGIQEISAQALLDYFQPLNDYLDNVPTEFITPSPITTELPTISTTEFLKRSASVFITDPPNVDVTTTESSSNINETTIKATGKTKLSETPQQNAGMYVGLAILACVAVVVVLVLVRNRLKMRRKNNNRRYET